MVYFLYGDIPLQLKYEDLLKNIRNKYSDIPTEYFDASTDDSENIFQALSSNNMFIPLSLIVIKRLEKLKDLSKFLKALGEFNYSQKIIILVYEEFLGDFDKATNEIDKTSLKYAEKLAEVIPARFALEKKALEFFVEEKLKCSKYETEKFLEIVGNDFATVKSEIEKVEAFFNGEAFDLEKAFSILSVSKEFSLFKLLESFLYNKQYTDLFGFLEKEKNYMLFLSLLSDEVAVLAKLKNLQKRGVITSHINFNLFKADVYPNIKNLFRKNSYQYINEYPLFLKFKYLDLFPYNFLEKKLLDCLDAEYKVKSGLQEDSIAISLLITDFFTKPNK